MFTRKVRFRDWKFAVDSELTRKTYEQELNGASDTCDCEYCRNFREQKESFYPEEVKSLFENLEIDFRKEDEVSQVNQSENGLHNYLGQFHFAGKILAGKKCTNKDSKAIELTEVTKNFSIGFCEKNNQFVEVWFEAHLPCVKRLAN